MVSYICPEKSQLVHTAITASTQTLKRLKGFQISVWCPHCQSGHKILAQDVLVAGTDSAKPIVEKQSLEQSREAMARS